jgi:hypothetical protein
MKRIWLIAVAAVALSAGCINEEEAIRDTASKYWQYILDGNTNAAYRMLSKESRFRVPRSEFEESVAFGGYENLNSRELRKIWTSEIDFIIEDVQQQGSQAVVMITFEAPDLDILADRMKNEAEREGIYQRFKNDEGKIANWTMKRMTEEIRKRRFNRMTIDNSTWLIRESGKWKIYLE